MKSPLNIIVRADTTAKGVVAVSLSRLYIQIKPKD